MKFTIIIFWLFIMPVLFCFSHTSIKSKKVLMQIETQDNYGIIEEDIIYKIKDNLNNINNSQNKTIIITIPEIIIIFDISSTIA